MRRKGEKMSAEAIKATAAIYRVTYTRHPLGQPTHWAKLYDVVTGEEKNHLEGANIKLVDMGIKIAGWEGFDPKVQIWWCVPLTPEQNAELQSALARIRPHMPVSS